MTKLKGLFLDDERDPEDVTWIKYPEGIQWDIVRSFKDFADADFKKYQMISFDHDLGDSCERTGYDCMKMYVDYLLFSNTRLEAYTLYYHTKNPVGEENMRKYFDNYISFTKEKLNG